MKQYVLSQVQTIGFAHEHPERTAVKSGMSWDSEFTFQVWPNRASMARSIRMQQKGPPRQDHWRALVPLTDGEGY